MNTNQRILIIDDDKRVVNTISKFLDRKKIDSEYSLTLSDGLKKVESGYFDVVFLDVMLSDGNGLDKISKILDRDFPPLVIIMTAYSDPDIAELAIENGVWNYLEKRLKTVIPDFSV